LHGLRKDTIADHIARASTLIRRRRAEVFDAFVDPDSKAALIAAS
jgi:hypothetical protein